MVTETQTEKGTQKARGIHNPVFKRLFTLKEAACYMGRSEYSMRELVWSHDLPVVKQESARKIYLDVYDLDKFIERNKTLYR